MGYTKWSDDFYRARNDDKRRKGIDAFAYDQDLKTKPMDQWKVHDRMDPKGAIRESRDSATHPESLAIAVFFDVTGSMGNIPRTLQKKLSKLLDLLVNKGYVAHPQIMFGAVGDAYTDRIPLQVGQFESGVEMDEDLERIVLEGNGGGQRRESYDLALYFTAKKTVTDCWEKRGKKGYLFTMGDEMAYSRTDAGQVKRLIGDKMAGNMPVKEVVKSAQERYEVFHLIVSGGCHGQEPEIEASWKKLLGERVLRLDQPDAVCETIALAIGLNEGQVGLANGAHDLVSAGCDSSLVHSVSRALAPLADSVGRRSIVKTGVLPTTAKSRIKRL